MYEENAIVVRNVNKSYSKNVKILNGLNMIVPKGCIYGLLGASGCGKTTLLSCITGIRKIDSGDIWVLGGKPGTEDSGIPGSRIGFMPQDICLVQEFTVIDALNYFGRISGMKDDEIKERYESLSKILQLPSKDRMIKNMSGGQKRRISFAAALLHNPELLILDEPTVGLDPVLRDSIWSYLRKITEENGTTVIITTHYIEEARQAHKIGLMRSGKLLTESTPDQLLDRFQCDNLEDAFFQLSKAHEDNVNIHSSEITEEIEMMELFVPRPTNSKIIPTKHVNNLSTSSGRLKALIIKNITQFIRRPSGMLFAIGFPCIQLILFYTSFGHDPRNSEIGVFNQEIGNCNFNNNIGKVIYTPDDYYNTCSFVDISCRFLHNINNTIAKKIYYDNFSDMERNLKKGKIVGMIYIGKNFSQALGRKIEQNTNAESEVFDMAKIQVSLDLTNRQVGLFLKSKLQNIYYETLENITQECYFPKKITKIPLHFEHPIFGNFDQDYTYFSSPNFILSLTFFLATAITASILISDKHEGIWERNIVQGVKTPEILFSHFVVELIVIAIQDSIISIVSYIYFAADNRGSWLAIIAMIFLMGICGMTYGFLVSSCCNSHIFADFIITGSFYPLILLGGFLWPLEGIPYVFRLFSYVLPTTIPAISLRALLIKGFSISNPEVYKGYLVIGGWIIVMFLLCLYSLKRKL